MIPFFMTPLMAISINPCEGDMMSRVELDR